MKSNLFEFIGRPLLMILGAMGLASDIKKMWAYTQTGEMSFQLQYTSPIFYGDEAFMYTGVMLVFWIALVLLGYTFVKKKV